MADNLGFSDLGAYGSEIRTPNIDSLAKQGRMYATPMPHTSHAEFLFGVGQHALVEALKKSGRLDNALIVITSTNGAAQALVAHRNPAGIDNSLENIASAIHGPHTPSVGRKSATRRSRDEKRKRPRAASSCLPSCSFQDRGETRDLAETHPEILTRLKIHFDGYMRATGISHP